MIDIKRTEYCCGCNACGDVCPKDAISFVKDNEGFEYPVINKDKCIDCHLCEKVCPILNVDKLKHNGYQKPVCYAAVNKNIETVFDSTSGGIFSALAEAMYKQDGYVGGAIWKEEDWHVEEYISNNREDLPRLRSSKYLQSLSEGFYKKIKVLLVAGEKVLVCGTPCQMSALRAYLNYEDYENLIIVDFICLGVNSPKVWRRYLDFREKENGGKVIYVKPKNKEQGWRNLTTKLVFDNGKVLYDTKETSIFTHGYIVTHAYCRPSCYECKFKGFPRIADITIADYWGGEKEVGKELDHDLGTSLVLINNEKGSAYYDSIKKSLIEKVVPLESTFKHNHALLTPVVKPIFDRTSFYKDLDELDFGEVAKKYHFDFSSICSKKRMLKNICHFFKDVKRASRFNIGLYIRNIYYNLFDSRFKAKVLEGNYFIANSNTVLNIDKSARIFIRGAFILGFKNRFPNSKLETRMQLEKNARVIIDNNLTIGYGADIEVFRDAILHVGANCGSNMGLTVVCAKEIVFGEGVKIGRNCTIRDNNGDHYIARRGYKTAYSLKIGQHSWLGESCTIIGGARLGDGVIVGAKSVVVGHCPSFSMMLGNPAQVVEDNIYWKY